MINDNRPDQSDITDPQGTRNPSDPADTRPSEEEKARNFLDRAATGREPDGPLPEDEALSEDETKAYAAERAASAAISRRPVG